jgi:hypothetical protein
MGWMSDKEGKDFRRQPRFDFGGTAMLVFDDPNKRRTLAITNYRNISKAGACIITPDSQSFTVGDHLFLMPERYRKKREAVVVDLGTGRLHLHIPRSDELSDFELAEVLQRLQNALEK